MITEQAEKEYFAKERGSGPATKDVVDKRVFDGKTEGYGAPVKSEHNRQLDAVEDDFLRRNQSKFDGNYSSDDEAEARLQSDLAAWKQRNLASSAQLAVITEAPENPQNPDIDEKEAKQERPAHLKKWAPKSSEQARIDQRSSNHMQTQTAGDVAMIAKGTGPASGSDSRDLAAPPSLDDFAQMSVDLDPDSDIDPGYDSCRSPGDSSENSSDIEDEDMSDGETKFIKEQLDGDMDLENFARFVEEQVLLTSDEESAESNDEPQNGPPCPPDGVDFPKGTPKELKESWYRYEDALEKGIPYEEALAQCHWLEAARRNRLL